MSGILQRGHQNVPYIHRRFLVFLWLFSCCLLLTIQFYLAKCPIHISVRALQHEVSVTVCKSFLQTVIFTAMRMIEKRRTIC